MAESTSDSEAFYGRLIDEYDRITGARRRVEPARRLIESLRRRTPVRSALDVACGTGLHAMLLAESGVAVTAADASEEMVARARRRAREADADIRFLTAPMQKVADRVGGPFDLVLCVGNSLPHLLEEADLAATFEGFARLLADDGLAVVHLLNYSRVLARRERIVGVTRGESAQYVRFYDFLPDGLLRFNVLTLRWRDGRCEHELDSTLLRPWRAGELTAALGAAGLGEIALASSPDLAGFDEADSDVLFLLAGRQATQSAEEAGGTQGRDEHG